MWLAQGWAQGLSWRSSPGVSPALLEPPAGQTANVTQTTTHRDTPLHMEIRQQGTRHGSRSCARPGGGTGLAEQGCLLWDENGELEWTGLGRETAPQQRAGPSLAWEERRTGEDSEEARGPAQENRRDVGDAGSGLSRVSGVTG